MLFQLMTKTAHKTALMRASAVCAALLWTACSTSSGGNGDTDASNSGYDAAGSADAAVVADAGIPQDAINPHIGDPCTTMGDCPDDGYCVEGGNGGVCTYECTDDECPYNYSCRVLDIDGNLVSVCVPVVPRHCSPCTTDDQCPGGACIQLEGSGYCVASCFESGCPDGTTCGHDPTGDHPGDFCVPNTGSCSCTPDNTGNVRTCSNTNMLGTCWGTETCDPNTGWTGCTAPTAEAEVCDGKDNDCNSLIDDGVGAGAACNNTNGFGTCAGTSICTGAGGLICQGPTASAEICNYTDDDCDSSVDEGFNNLGTPCSAGVGACERFGVIACTANGSGTECSATAGTGTTEMCNGVDDDCMGDIDEDFTDLGNPCTVSTGICARVGEMVCKSDGLGTECSATPGPADPSETCNSLDDDCDGKIDEGFLNQTTMKYDQDTTCGSCAVDCTQIYNLPNASGSCDASGTPTCVMDCTPDTFNLNGVIADGCEFVLDPQAIYVSTSDPAAVDDAGCGLGPVGTGAGHYPCKTIAQGQSRAGDLGRIRVLVANGIYDEPVTMTNGISLLGGYLWDTWERDVAATGTQITGVMALGSHDVTVMANGITSVTLFEGFVVVGAVNGATGGNSYALYVAGCDNSFTIRSNVIIGGRGGPGGNGTPGSDGSNGVPGIGRTSNPGAYDAHVATGTLWCDASANNRQYSNGGSKSCGGDNVSGGAGGGNKCDPEPDINGGELSGIDGFTGQPGAGGGGGAGAGADAGNDTRLWTDGVSYLCTIQADPIYGLDGTNGTGGSQGAAVAGCSATSGSVVGGHWVGSTGTNGLAGANGGGGGGGGAGGGSYCDIASGCPETKDRIGGHGGGGGSGGCAGTGGGGATSGGAAFGIFIVGGSAPTITDNTVTRGEGGNGGTGGGGGTGGDGGTGAQGGTSTTFCAGRAGRGGNGGDGGHGSGGGGGCGGGSYGIYTSGIGTPTYCSGAGNTFSGGVAGAGGSGGFSIANPGGNGAAGQLLNCSYN